MKISREQSILAAMAGITNGEFTTKFSDSVNVGKVTIGGYPIGKDMIEAAIEATKRGRKEFILQDGKEACVISQELEKIKFPYNTIINIRVNSKDDIKRFISQLHSEVTDKPVIEINAHCQQQEFLVTGGGQNLINRPRLLEDMVHILQSFDYNTSLKIRGNQVDPNIFSKIVNKWDIDYLHVDSYKIGVLGTDLNLLRKFTDQCRASVIGNNSVVDRESAENILKSGANFFSIARAVLSNSNIFNTIIDQP